MFHQLEAILIGYAAQVPLELFAILASFIEEVIAPIPSPAVMLATGSLASLQGRPFYGLFALSILGAIGKLAGALVVYFIADKAEDLFTGKLGRFFGLQHDDIEAFGKRLGRGWKDYAVLTLLRALPIMPSSVVSAGSGLLKVRLRLYVISTFLGTIVRDFIYLYFGYAGIIAAASLFKKSATIESFIQAGAVLAIAVFLAWAYYRRKKIKNSSPHGEDQLSAGKAVSE